MSKLSPEQKALNKQAAQLRNRAYAARQKAYREDAEAAEQALRDGDLGHATREADLAFDRALSARSSARLEIEAQIAQLQLKLANLLASHEKHIEPCRAARKEAWDRLRAAQTAANETVKAKYPDVADCWSASAWRPLEDFLPQVLDAK